MYKGDENIETLESLIYENKNLIYNIASKFSKYKNKEDLFQAGCIGMIEAYNNFDPNRGCKFTSYAYPYIFGEISKYVQNDHNIKLSRDMARLKSKVEKAKTYLSQLLFHEPTIKELSDYLELDKEVVEQILNYNECYSLDEPVVDDLSLHEVIADKEIDYDTLITLRNELDSLGEPERSIMYQRYFKDLTQREIASNLGLSQVDVSRKEKKVLTKLKQTIN